ncbi:mRNA-capping enzyme subunit alpha [Astathelohania contejeani]|uniref:mRNA guanylyltransferase n=1 Tax=Astathelohania contejeani TaxID=164912 RepID=A0ABQ7HWC2_9MICR|nr:mRNA-capping enzyme subunit alpha [Thelohania contejeani]
METYLKILGNQISSKDSRLLLKQIHEIIDTMGVTPQSHQLFPGAHPVTLLQKNIDVLLEEDYYVCEKSDGIRLMLYIFTKDNITRGFFFDRKNIFYHIQLPFPILIDTLLDGEFFIDIVNEKKYLVFSIFDTLIYNGKNYQSEKLIDRLGIANKFQKELCTYWSQISPPFKITVKQMYKSYGFYQVYKEAYKLHHGNDGLIFTPVNNKYIPFSNEMKIYKWKPPHLNTVDFLLCPLNSGIYKLQCYGKQGSLITFDYFIPEEDNSEYNNSIGEFFFDEKRETCDVMDDYSIYEGSWSLLKIRRDKTTPNSFKIVNNILISIKENLTFKDLEKYYEPMCKNWKQRNKI